MSNEELILDQLLVKLEEEYQEWLYQESSWGYCNGLNFAIDLIKKELGYE